MFEKRKPFLYFLSKVGPLKKGFREILGKPWAVVFNGFGGKELVSKRKMFMFSSNASELWSVSRGIIYLEKEKTLTLGTLPWKRPVKNPKKNLSKHRQSHPHGFFVYMFWDVHVCLSKARFPLYFLYTVSSKLDQREQSRIQLFRERLSVKMCMQRARKVMWDMMNTLFRTL